MAGPTITIKRKAMGEVEDVGSSKQCQGEDVEGLGERAMLEAMRELA